MRAVATVPGITTQATRTRGQTTASARPAVTTIATSTAGPRPVSAVTTGTTDTTITDRTTITAGTPIAPTRASHHTSSSVIAIPTSTAIAS